MARCTAVPPCDYKANGEVHDFGCPARGRYYPGELGELYLTETAEERERLNLALEKLLWRTGYCHHFEPADVTGTHAEWLLLRRAIRAGDSPTGAAAPFTLTLDGGAPALVARP